MEQLHASTVEESELIRNSDETPILRFGNDILHSTDSKPCPSRTLHFSLQPWIDYHYILGYDLKFNVTIEVYNPQISFVALQQGCVQSSIGQNIHDALCSYDYRTTVHNYSRSCRLFQMDQIVSSQNARLVQINFPCFSVGFHGSVYTLHLLAYPSMCENVYLYSAPNIRNIQVTKIDDWIPLVVATIDEHEQLSIMINRPPDFLVVNFTMLAFNVKLYTVEMENKKKKIDETILTDADSIQYPKLKRAHYFVLVTVVTNKCEAANSCKSSSLKFVLAKDLIEKKTSWIPVSLFVAFLVALGIVIFWKYETIRTVLASYRRYQRQQQTLPVTVAFHQKPKIFLIYSDDCLEHRKCVVKLAEYLRDNVNCDVFFDEWTFLPNVNSLGLSETEWVLDCAQKCDFFLIVFSIGSKILWNKPTLKSLIPIRSGLEVFNLSITCVLEHILSQTRLQPIEKLSRVLCCQIQYDRDDADYCNVPDQFKLLPCPKFKITSEVVKLIAHIQNMPDDFTLSNDELVSGLTSLNNQISRTNRYFGENIDWLDQRLEPVRDHDQQNLLIDLHRRIDNVEKFRVPLIQQDNNEEEYPIIDFDQSKSIDNHDQDEELIFPLIEPDQKEERPHGSKQNNEQPYRPLMELTYRNL